SPPRRRKGIRWKVRHPWTRLEWIEGHTRVLPQNRSVEGLGVLYYGAPIPDGQKGTLTLSDGATYPVRMAHNQRRFFWLRQGGLALLSGMFLFFHLSPAHGQKPSAEWYLRRGRDNAKISNYKAAVEAYQKVLEIDPREREALLSLSKAYQAMGLLDKAIE